ncbi:hypothetical protein GCM10022246_25830 [Pedobacter ginsengiterrae]|uniref:Uncharacterized protein n=1 Tax=Pedobacter ginsengiterrae TaxID=871696 RepID=A0ABP7PWN0_9SPHI
MLIAVLLIDISTDFDTKASIATRNEFIATDRNNFFVAIKQIVISSAKDKPKLCYVCIKRLIIALDLSYLLRFPLFVLGL